MIRILLDMDGVLADFDAKLFADTAEVIQWPSEALRRTRRFCTDHLPSNQERRYVRRHIETTPFFRDLPVIEGARKGVRELEEMGFDLWVVSKPLESNPTCASDKYAWVADHFPTLAGKVILTPDKSLIHGGILLDDAIKDRERALASWTPVHYSYPHNAAKTGYRFTWEFGASTLAQIAVQAESTKESL